MSGKPAKKAAKLAATKKTAAKKSARKAPAKQATVAKKPAATVPAGNNRATGGIMNGPLAFMLAGTLALGIGIGMMVESRNAAPDAANGDMTAQMTAFINDNPQLILDSVRTYSARMEREARDQAINLVRANDGNTIMGNPDGDITIYEFSDYNCGYCKRSFNMLMELARQDDNIRIVIKEFPILAQSSVDAAKLAIAAGEIGKFEAFHTALMTWQGGLDDLAYASIAEAAGTSLEELNSILENLDTDAIINDTRNAAQQLNISGTPAFIVGDTLVPGAVSLEEMQDLVKAAREAQQG